MNRDPIAVLNLDQHVKCGRRLPLEHRLLGAAPPRLLVGEGHALDAAQEVVERRVHEQVLERLTVRGRDELHAALRNGPRRRRLELCPDLIDDDYLGHVVLDRLDHHGMLQQRRLHLHAPRAPNAGMRDIAVAADLI